MSLEDSAEFYYVLLWDLNWFYETKKKMSVDNEERKVKSFGFCDLHFID